MRRDESVGAGGRALPRASLPPAVEAEDRPQVFLAVVGRSRTADLRCRPLSRPGGVPLPRPHRRCGRIRHPTDSDPSLRPPRDGHLRRHGHLRGARDSLAPRVQAPVWDHDEGDGRVSNGIVGGCIHLILGVATEEESPEEDYRRARALREDLAQLLWNRRARRRCREIPGEQLGGGIPRLDRDVADALRGKNSPHLRQGGLPRLQKLSRRGDDRDGAFVGECAQEESPPRKGLVLGPHWAAH
mmetsp:Transcript_27720/g.111009  ORF Transcript_27720/g.111009 Transcript_27720/m.111009 type:complete len:243 (-) Transcript_27720:128-856(-)